MLGFGKRQSVGGVGRLFADKSGLAGRWFGTAGGACGGTHGGRSHSADKGTRRKKVNMGGLRMLMSRAGVEPASSQYCVPTM